MLVATAGRRLVLKYLGSFEDLSGSEQGSCRKCDGWKRADVPLDSSEHPLNSPSATQGA